MIPLRQRRRSRRPCAAAGRRHPGRTLRRLSARLCRRKEAERARLHAALERRVADHRAELEDAKRRLSQEARVRADAERERRRTRERYAGLLNSIDGIVWEADACTLRFGFISKKAEVILGYPLSRWLDEPTFWADHLHPDDRDWCIAFCNEATEERRDHVFEYRMIAADGRIVWLRDLVTVVVDGDAASLRGIMVDITARKVVEEERRLLIEQLDESHALLDALFRTAPIGLGYLDRSLCFVRINDELAAIHGAPAAAHLGRSIEDVLPAMAPQVAPHLQQVLATGQPILGAEVRGELPSAPGELRWCLASYYPVRRGEAVVGVGLVVTDITDEKRAAQEIGALAAERGRLLAEAQRALRARDVFLQVASHELKTPLMPLQLNLQHVRAVLSARPGDERLNERLDVALRQVDRLARQVEAMLDVARADTGGIALHPIATDVAAIARAVTARLASEAACSHCTFEVHADDPAVAEVDPARVQQVIESLLTNALRYGRGASVAVSVSSAPGVVRVAVEDQGIGIAPEDQDRIFGLFERAVSERRYGGLGLGLYLARRIVEAHGGQISCSSAPGAGARFEVDLPVAVRRRG